MQPGRVQETFGSGSNDGVAVVVDRFVEEYLKRECKASWAKEAERLLRVEIVSVWGKRKMPEITDDDVVRRMEEIARRSGTTANRTFAVWRKLCNWAANAKRKIIKASPCTGLEKPASETKRDRILSDAELRLIWQAAEGLGYPFGPLFKVLLLTGQRRGETAAMCWNEIDNDGVWMIPATKTKNGLTHLVPLPLAVIDLLKTLPRLSPSKGEMDYVFSPGARSPSGFRAPRSAWTRPSWPRCGRLIHRPSRSRVGVFTTFGTQSAQACPPFAFCRMCARPS